MKKLIKQLQELDNQERFSEALTLIDSKIQNKKLDSNQIKFILEIQQQLFLKSLQNERKCGNPEFALTFVNKIISNNSDPLMVKEAGSNNILTVDCTYESINLEALFDNLEEVKLLFDTFSTMDALILTNKSDWYTNSESIEKENEYGYFANYSLAGTESDSVIVLLKDALDRKYKNALLNTFIKTRTNF